jgi:hypothetical protein
MSTAAEHVPSLREGRQQHPAAWELVRARDRSTKVATGGSAAMTGRLRDPLDEDRFLAQCCMLTRLSSGQDADR